MLKIQIIKSYNIVLMNNTNKQDTQKDNKNNI